VAATAFLGGGVAPFLVHEVFEGDDEEGAEAAFAGVGGVEPVMFEEAGEEFLGEVLGVVGGTAAAAGVGVEGVPVAAADGLEGGGGAGGLALGGGEDHRPAGGWKQPGGITGGGLTAHGGHRI